MPFWPFTVEPHVSYPLLIIGTLAGAVVTGIQRTPRATWLLLAGVFLVPLVIFILLALTLPGPCSPP